MNGIDDLEPVAKLINWGALTTKDPGDASDAACGVFIQQNAEPLRQIFASLEKPWMRRIDFHDSDTLLPEIEAIRSWQRVLLADARHQLALGRPDLAARDYLAMVRLGGLCGRGGAGLDVTVGDAIRGVGLAEIASHIDRFDQNSLDEIASTLELLDRAQEPLALVSQRDHLFQRYTTGWIGRLHFWAEREAYPQRPSTEESVLKVRNRTDVTHRLAMLETAVRAYESRHREFPPSLAALVPEYLTAVPNDPLGQHPFVYRRTNDCYLLYSIGANGIDDGGQRVTRHEALNNKAGDLFLDASNEVE